MREQLVAGVGADAVVEPAAQLGRELDLMRHIDAEGPRYAAARAAGEFDTAAVIAGEVSGLVHDVPPARDIVLRTIAEAETLLRGPYDRANRPEPAITR